MSTHYSGTTYHTATDSFVGTRSMYNCYHFLFYNKNYCTQAQAEYSYVQQFPNLKQFLYYIPFLYLTLDFFGMCLVLAYW